ncbi:hypothetical protein [Paenibacillus sp. Leaf72]|uniref:hypothetical protein n=1 Tax=Paenibacillus sp. Leaf72 TaxID=1736234 RepID=UPI0006F6DEFC|nr:hypothetical protein [Paenibacillus sp. Leaf72]KQO17265.1 hypothetical protein ASF12_00790 [Paenibacillus sp. Leaf72]
MGDLFSQTLQQLGLTEADVSKGTLRTGDKPGPNYLSTRPEYESALSAKRIIVKSLEQLQSIIGANDSNGGELDIPKPWPASKSGMKTQDLTELDERQLYDALRACLAGRQNEVQSYADILNARYFPMSLSVFTTQDIVVSAGSPLIISPQGHDPVSVTCNTLTLEQGGQIICEAPVILTCNTFIKN